MTIRQFKTMSFYQYIARIFLSGASMLTLLLEKTAGDLGENRIVWHVKSRLVESSRIFLWKLTQGWLRVDFWLEGNHAVKRLLICVWCSTFSHTARLWHCVPLSSSKGLTSTDSVWKSNKLCRQVQIFLLGAGCRSIKNITDATPSKRVHG